MVRGEKRSVRVVELFSEIDWYFDCGSQSSTSFTNADTPLPPCSGGSRIGGRGLGRQKQLCRFSSSSNSLIIPSRFVGQAKVMPDFSFHLASCLCLHLGPDSWLMDNGVGQAIEPRRPAHLPPLRTDKGRGRRTAGQGQTFPKPPVGLAGKQGSKWPNFLIRIG